MESTATVSVSKGVFVFPNGIKKGKQGKKKKNTFIKHFSQEPWYVAYSANWNKIEQQLKDLHHRTYNTLLVDIVDYIRTLFSNNKEYDENIIPSATLLTGVNQPDHLSQFNTLINKLREEVSPHVAMVHSQDGGTVKQLLENVVWQLMNSCEETDTLFEDFTNLNIGSVPKSKVKKSDCTLSALLCWYRELYSTQSAFKVSPRKKKKVINEKKALVVIIPDFESFNCQVLQDFILILSSYTTVLPVAMVFGVATSVSALHKSFPYHVSSKLMIRVFHSLSSPAFTNQVIEEIFLNHQCPFQLSGRAFELLTDVFLFYDLSVTGFIQGVKYCMMEHYYRDNIKSLCCDSDKVSAAIENLDTESLEEIKKLKSFTTYISKQEEPVKKLLNDNEMFKDTLRSKINDFHEYLNCFYTTIRILHVFVKDLPKNVLGKTIRQIYAKCTVQRISENEGYQECMQLLLLQSQITLLEGIRNALQVVNMSLTHASPVKPLLSPRKKNSSVKTNISLDESVCAHEYMKIVRVNLLMFAKHIEEASQERSLVKRQRDVNMDEVPLSRNKLKEKLLKATELEMMQSEFEMVRSRFVSFLEDIFKKSLQLPQTKLCHEIFVFNDILSVKKQIIGSPRGAVHTALTNPRAYLQCSCCILPEPDSVLRCLPDVCILYKLHRECGKHINLYDWLQAFAAVVDPGDQDDERRDISMQIQGRFNNAVAELQLLGFIKPSKRKTDHVMRLTW